ncbi:MAG: hypothetical protein OEU92_01520 [Alphaproteobacteria bacterium]|nr:hypothetical protein [Alphaproteobacteria bacterium]
MSGTDLVEDVGVDTGNVSESDPAIHDVLEHLLIDRARESVLVGALGDQVLAFRRLGIRDGRFKDLMIDLVEVDLPSVNLFLAERHDDKAG